MDSHWFHVWVIDSSPEGNWIRIALFFFVLQPNREDEYARIEALGGKVIQWNGYRVLGVLAMSRSIGMHSHPFDIIEPVFVCASLFMLLQLYWCDCADDSWLGNWCVKGKVSWLVHFVILFWIVMIYGALGFVTFLSEKSLADCCSLV